MTHLLDLARPTGDSSSRRTRLLLLALGGLALLLVLSACGRVDNATTFEADGSGVQTLTVVMSESDLAEVDGGVDAIESAIDANNPGLTYEGSTQDGSDTLFTFTLAFEDAEDYAAKAQPVLEAGGISRTAEVTFTPPSPPFTSGYTMTRNFSALDLTRWAVTALLEEQDSGATESDVDSALDQGEVTVEVDGEPLEQAAFLSDDAAAEWSNAESVGFSEVQVVTAGAEDPSADSYTRTLTYTLDRAVYLESQDEFDAFFAAAVPEGGELTPAGDAGTTWVVTFPAGTAEQVGGWTDTALATSGSTFTVEAGANAEDSFLQETRVVDDIDCTVACAGGALTQSLEVPAGTFGETDPSVTTEGIDGRVTLQGGPEPEVLTRTIRFTEVDYELIVDRDGGGSLSMDLTLPETDEALVGEDQVLALLGEDTERSTADGMVTYSRTAEAEDSAEFSGALQRLGFIGEDGPPEISVLSQGDGLYAVTIVLGLDDPIAGKVGTGASWTIRGEGLRPTAVLEDGLEAARLGEDYITLDGYHGVILRFQAERTGLGSVGITLLVVGLALFGLLVAVGIVAFLNRERLRALLAGRTGTASVQAGEVQRADQEEAPAADPAAASPDGPASGSADGPAPEPTGGTGPR